MSTSITDSVHKGTEELPNWNSNKPTNADPEMTLRQQDTAELETETDRESCLVQIYPTDVVDGMLLLDANCLEIGRGESNDVVLNDLNVSRNHAQIIRTPAGYLLKDLNSTNGTYLNESQVDSRILESGDSISIGGFIYKFLSADSVESQYHEAIYSSLTRDGLTGAMNKRYLLESMQREIARCRRGGQPLSLVMIDIDHFKSVNDTYGHLVGDEVLRELGARMISASREDDLFARYGGEEFSLLLASTGQAEAIEIAERCRELVAAEPFETQAGELSITASFGIECFDGSHNVTPDDLIGAADQRLYDAKANGRNRVEA